MEEGGDIDAPEAISAWRSSLLRAIRSGTAGCCRSPAAACATGSDGCEWPKGWVEICVAAWCQ
jgi:hypothetical protein